MGFQKRITSGINGGRYDGSQCDPRPSSNYAVRRGWGGGRGRLYWRHHIWLCVERTRVLSPNMWGEVWRVEVGLGTGSWLAGHSRVRYRKLTGGTQQGHFHNWFQFIYIYKWFWTNCKKYFTLLPVFLIKRYNQSLLLPDIRNKTQNISVLFSLQHFHSK